MAPDVTQNNTHRERERARSRSRLRLILILICANLSGSVSGPRFQPCVLGTALSCCDAFFFTAYFCNHRASLFCFDEHILAPIKMTSMAFFDTLAQLDSVGLVRLSSASLPVDVGMHSSPPDQAVKEEHLLDNG